MEGFRIVFKDDHFVVIHKPAGFLVHRTRISDGTDFVLQNLRDQLGARVYPVHRLDRQASGLLLLGLSPEAASALGKVWMSREVQKSYLLMVRGRPAERGEIDRALKRKQDGVMQEAFTRFELLDSTTLPQMIPGREISIYSLVRAWPATGRMHQLRRHFAGISHPVIGCAKHGDYRHNKAIEQKYGVKRLHLVCDSLSFIHPFTEENLTLRTQPDEELTRFWSEAGFSETKWA